MKIDLSDRPKASISFSLPDIKPVRETGTSTQTQRPVFQRHGHPRESTPCCYLYIFIHEKNMSQKYRHVYLWGDGLYTFIEMLLTFFHELL